MADFGRSLVAGTAVFGVLLGANLLSRGGLGLGDVKLGFPLGLYLGWLGWGEVALGIFLSFLSGAVLSIGLIVSGHTSRKGVIAFGPSLMLGTLITVLCGEPVLDWYSATP